MQTSYLADSHSSKDLQGWSCWSQHACRLGIFEIGSACYDSQIPQAVHWLVWGRTTRWMNTSRSGTLKQYMWVLIPQAVLDMNNSFLVPGIFQTEGRQLMITEWIYLALWNSNCEFYYHRQCLLWTTNSSWRAFARLKAKNVALLNKNNEDNFFFCTSVQSPVGKGATVKSSESFIMEVYIKAVFLYCCPDCPSFPAHLNCIGLATCAISAAIKKCSPIKQWVNFRTKLILISIAAQVAWPIWIALVRQLVQFRPQYRNTAQISNGLTSEQSWF